MGFSPEKKDTFSLLKKLGGTCPYCPAPPPLPGSAAPAGIGWLLSLYYNLLMHFHFSNITAICFLGLQI